MATQEKTLQQLDPLAAGTSWDSTIVIVIVGWAYAILMSVIGFEKATNPFALFIALASLSIALGLHLWFAHPSHAPYRRISYGIVVTLAITAGTFQVWAMSGTSVSFVQEWGPISVALLFASASGYRPLKDQYYAGLAAVLTLGVELWFVGAASELPFGPAYFAVSGVCLIAIVVLGQASYTMKATRVYFSWLEAAQSPQPMPQISVPSLESAKALLIGILESGKVTEADNKNSTALSAAIRTELLELSHNDWIEHEGYALEDADNLSERFDPSAQTTFLSLLEGLTHNNVVDIHVSLTLDSLNNRISVVVLGRYPANIKMSSSKLRALLSPYLRVMYVVFEHVRIISHDKEVKVMFYYDQ